LVRTAVRERGFTFLEMVATTSILVVLASVILPLAKVSRQRHKEADLKRTLRTVRNAIDDFKRATGTGRIGGTDVKLETEGYPPDLETLVKGTSEVGRPTKKLKFLRRVPVDPMTGETEWGLRCYQDEPDSDSWCGKNVYDIYTKSEGQALDGSKYKDW
jgi:general secretion pathway protein G